MTHHHAHLLTFFEMGSLSSLLLAVAFLVGNSECYPTTREKRSKISTEVMNTCENGKLIECTVRLAAVIDNLQTEIEGKLTEIVGNFVTLRLSDPQH